MVAALSVLRSFSALPPKFIMICIAVVMLFTMLIFFIVTVSHVVNEFVTRGAAGFAHALAESAQRDFIDRLPRGFSNPKVVGPQNSTLTAEATPKAPE
jgi:hypothetical protein